MGGENSTQHDRVLEALFKVEAMSVDMAAIKEAMRDMAQALNRLAVIEERQSQATAAIERAHKRIDLMEPRVGDLEKAQPLNQRTSAWVDKAIWAVVAAVITAGVSLVLTSKAAEQRAVQQVPTLVAPK